MEDEAVGLWLDEVGQDKARSQGHMAAEVYFTARREPAKAIGVPFFYGESRFRQVVFHGNGLHQFIGQPSIQNADSCRIAFKNFFRKSIDDVTFHKNPSFKNLFSCLHDSIGKIGIQ